MTITSVPDSLVPVMLLPLFCFRHALRIFIFTPLFRKKFPLPLPPPPFENFLKIHSIWQIVSDNCNLAYLRGAVVKASLTLRLYPPIN